MWIAKILSLESSALGVPVVHAAASGIAHALVIITRRSLAGDELGTPRLEKTPQQQRKSTRLLLESHIPPTISIISNKFSANKY
jgi:hypothetical protein